MSDMKYYKVICKDSKSSWIGRYSNVFDNVTVIYDKMNEWISPKIEGSKLFVFRSLKAAQRFAEIAVSDNNFELYECEVKNPVSINRRLTANVDMDVERVLTFWRAYNVNNDDVNCVFSTVYVGVREDIVCVDRLKLVKQIS